MAYKVTEVLRVTVYNPRTKTSTVSQIDDPLVENIYRHPSGAYDSGVVTNGTKGFVVRKNVGSNVWRAKI